MIPGEPSSGITFSSYNLYYVNYWQVKHSIATDQINHELPL